jgi:hypothetical protein
MYIYILEENVLHSYLQKINFCQKSFLKNCSNPNCTMYNIANVYKCDNI